MQGLTDDSDGVIANCNSISGSKQLQRCADRRDPESVGDRDGRKDQTRKRARHEQDRCVRPPGSHLSTHAHTLITTL